MKKAWFILSVLLFFVSPHALFSQKDDGHLWKEMLPVMQSALKLKDKQEKLPKSAILHKDKGDNQKDIDKLLDKAAGILLISETQNYRVEIQKEQDKIQEENRKILEYEEKRIAAPEKKAVWKAWETTSEKYSEKIEDAKKEIKKRENRIADIKESVNSELSKLGLEVTSEQLDFLLSTVVGENSLEVLIAFDNVKALTIQLEKLTAQSGENLDIAKRYYGMYVVLLEILDRMYFNIIDDIDHQYIPQIDGGKVDGKKIEGIVPRTQQLLKQTETLLQKNSSTANREILSANLRAQKLTLEAARLYKTYLEKQRADISQAKMRLAPDLATAQNTYATVQVSSELLTMMQTGQNLFDALKNIQLPELRVFENVEMKKEFEKLTLKLKSPQPS